ncbi:MAG: Hsp70 family protein [Thermoguttaceae bacterium]
MHFEPGQTVGIDLGTTFSTIAVLNQEGAPTPLPNEDDDVETASMVLLTARGHVIVGPNRSRAAMEDPERVVQWIKRHMGATDYKREFDGHAITPEFLSALILKKLRQDAERRIGPIANAVITVPYYFNDQRRKATEDAGRIAGFNVVDIINEPTAATLTYAWQMGDLGRQEKAAGDKPHRVMIYDLGGGTFDVTVVEYTPTHFRVLATDGDVELGGVDWNNRVLEYVADQFKEKFGEDLRESRQTVQILHNDCDLAKVELSQKTEVKVPCRHNGKHMNVSVTRQLLDQLTADLLERTSTTIELVVEQAKIAFKDLDSIVLVGGATVMPQVRDMVERVTGRKPFLNLDPYTSVAKGAAIHAAILEVQNNHGGIELNDKVRKMLGSVQQENVNSHALGIIVKDRKTGGFINHVMISKNSRLPAEVRQTFVTNRYGQERVTVRVVQGDAPDPAACAIVGECRITDLPPNLPQGSPVEVTYAFDTSGRIRVRAMDKTCGKEAVTEIDRRGGLKEEQVDSFAKLAADYKVE